MPLPVLDSLQACFDSGSVADAMRAHQVALRRHGDFDRWQEALQALPDVAPTWSIRDGWLHAGAPLADPEPTRALLKRFIPWRKGPLVLGGVAIETEWRSDFKWQRLAAHIQLGGARVLDVGAGNGYFGWQMLNAGASLVVGCDPTPLFVFQHGVIRHFAGVAPHALLALRLEDLPPGLDHFDVVFSMGVLYHRRDPAEHLQQLRQRLGRPGLLVLETLIAPDADSLVLQASDRYAGMRNVHVLPSLPRLLAWLDQAGFKDARCLDISVTTPEEQRSTDWMPFHSLAQALDQDNQALTIEGLPRPRRAMLLAAV